jgi:CII-binding regulator of phage lambda lysogenization HflD
MSRRNNRRRYRKQRKNLFMRQLISYLSSEKKLQEKEKITEITDRLDKVLVSEDHNAHKDHNIHNILRDLTI